MFIAYNSGTPATGWTGNTFFGTNATAIEGRARMRCPNARTASALHLDTDVPIEAGGSLTATFRQNGTNTPLSVTLIAGQTSVEDTTHTVTLADGDWICGELVGVGLAGSYQINVSLAVA